MAKNKKPVQSTSAKTRQLKAADAREQAIEVQKARDKAYRRGLMAAARLRAKQQGFADGMRAEQKKRR